jgi:hypothetical protein
VAHGALVSQEEKYLGTRVVRWRLTGALLMGAAIVLVLV